MVWVIIGLFCFLLMVCVINARIYISLRYQYIQKQHLIILRVHFLKIPIYRKKIKLEDTDEIDVWDVIQEMDFAGNMNDVYSRLKSIFPMIHRIGNILKQVLARIKFHTFQWQTHIGTGDAVTTGLAAGGIWSIKGMVAGFIYKWSNLTNSPSISVQPIFQLKHFQMQLNCILSVKLGQAIYMTVTMTKHISASKAAC